MVGDLILSIFGRKLSSEQQTKMAGEQKEYRNDSLDNFVQQLTAAQTSLRAYILASLGNHNDASDVLQRTNLALWKNASNFRSGSEFMPWAVTIAKYEILSFCRDRSRDRHVYPEDLAELMLETACHEVADPVDRLEALRHCLSKLPPKHSDLLQLRYYEEKSISQIAEVLRRTENSVKSAFVRIRRTLQKCIQRRLKSPSA